MNKRILKHKVISKLRTMVAIILFLAFSLYSSAAPAYAASIKRPQKNPTLIPYLNQIYNIHVNQDGMYRLTYEDLREAGFNLAGIRFSDIAITHAGLPAPIRTNDERSFGPGSYIDFYGQALDTLYTDTNVYQIQINPALNSQVASEEARMMAKTSATDYYMESLRYYPKLAYNVASPTSAPWYFQNIYTNKTPKSWDYSFELDHFMPGAAPVSFSLELYGGNDAFQRPDHHVQISLNDQPVAEAIFDGIIAQTLSTIDAPVQPGANTLTIRLPGDTGASSDSIFIEGYTISYPRALVARQGRLEFTASGSLIKVSGLDAPNAAAYRLEADGPVFLAAAEMQEEDGAYSVLFNGAGEPAKYWVSTPSGFLRAKISPSGTRTDIKSGQADYIMISHPDLITGLQALVQARQQQGYSLRVVDVNEIYQQFSYGVIDPAAIQAYIRHAYYQMGARYVLLVGADSYDYRNYLGLGHQSLIPTLYFDLDPTSMYSPGDPLYADVDGDRVPDLALGRFPARNLNQLETLIAKTLAYESASHSNTSIFSSDKFFSSYSDAWANLLPENWGRQFANLDQLPLAEAKNLLVSNMNTGVDLVSYFGHSTVTAWSANKLFTTSDVPTLNNQSQPFIVAQYGCWNTYFVNPRQASLGEQFLLEPGRGAAAVLGSASNNYMDSQSYLGKYLTPRLASPGMTIGQALLSAKQGFAADLPYRPEIHLGWTILGDPALVLTP